MKYISHILLICLFSTQLYAQTDSTQNNSLLQELNASTADQEKLLPNKMMITQRMLWGEKGLMRKFNRFELTPVKRQNDESARALEKIDTSAMTMSSSPCESSLISVDPPRHS